MLMWVYVKIMHGEGFLVHLVFSMINVQMGVFMEQEGLQNMMCQYGF
jgi:hypothetical protein